MGLWEGGWQGHHRLGGGYLGRDRVVALLLHSRQAH